MIPKRLHGVTLIICDCKNYGNAYFALQESLKQITPDRTIFLTDIEINKDPRIETVQIPSIRTVQEYSRFLVKELYKYFTTQHCIVIQHDGYVINGESWDDEFYNYSYIGSPWLYSDGRNVGNGAMSLRSYELQYILGTDDFIEMFDPEDEVIGRLYRRYLEFRGITYAPEDVAEKFAYELNAPVCKTFGFHGKFHQPFTEAIIIKRTGAGGDVVAMEPVLEYFHSKGYRVAIDTLPQFYNYFTQHYFKVHHPLELNEKVRTNAKKINLDMAYEVNPKQNHLKSYFEMCGITDYKLRNPKLTLTFDPKHPANKPFKKYCVVHIDKRDSKQGRNVVGINWWRVTQVLKKEGFEVIQIGMGEADDIGGVRMNTPSEMTLMYVIGGADMFLGIDSGCANIAVAMSVPSIIFFGSVTPEHIYPDLTNVKVIQHEKPVCGSYKCWSSKISTEGVACIEDENIPPCTIFSTEDVIKKIQEVINPV